MKLTDKQRKGVEELNVFTKIIGFELPENMLLRMYFALPVYIERKDQFDLADAARAIRMADEITRNRYCEVRTGKTEDCGQESEFQKDI